MPPAVARADYVRNGRLAAVGSEDRIVPPQCGSVGIVQIRNRLAQFVRQTFADIEASPLGMHEIGRSSRTQLAGRTRRPGSIKANRNDVVKRYTRQSGGDFQAVCDLLQAHLRSLL